MKRIFSAVIIAACLVGVGTGCYSTVEGDKRAGVPFLKDRLESRYERSVESVFEAARAVLQFNGTLTSENRVINSLEARIDNTTVWVRVEEVEPGITMVQTQARGSGSGSRISIASEIDKQIALHLQANP